MNPLIRFIATLIFSIFYRPFILMAQESESFIENMAVLDSSYMEQPFMADAVSNSSGSGNLWIFIVAGLAVISAAAYFILKNLKR